MNRQAFRQKHQLSESYWQMAERYFSPLAEQLIELQDSKNQQTLYVGINGCQGSGKTTLADYLVNYIEQAGLVACAISIDDFYLTKSQRQQLAHDIHPLLATRGVPGTHDVDLAVETLTGLSKNAKVAIPRFNKAIDDRYPSSMWEMKSAPINIVILEGWCVAVTPQTTEELMLAVNSLEQQNDRQGRWRQFVNTCLATDYLALWEMLDTCIMLKAPSFDSVYRWRLEQEEKLRQQLSQNDGYCDSLMSSEEIKHFIAHYQRLTERALNNLPECCDIVFELDNNRNIERIL